METAGRWVDPVLYSPGIQDSEGDVMTTNQVSMNFDPDELEKMILNLAQVRTGIRFSHVNIEIKNNVIESITVYSKFIAGIKQD